MHSEQFIRSIEYFRTILQAPKRLRWKLLHVLPSHVIDDYIQIMDNIMLGNININVDKIKKYKDILLEMTHAKSNQKRKAVLLKHFPTSWETHEKTHNDGNQFTWLTLKLILSWLKRL